MYIDYDAKNELLALQEDTAEYFTHEFFPVSGEAYWTCVESIATAKLAELRGEIDSNVMI